MVVVIFMVNPVLAPILGLSLVLLILPLHLLPVLGSMIRMDGNVAGRAGISIFRIGVAGALLMTHSITVKPYRHLLHRDRSIQGALLERCHQRCDFGADHGGHDADGRTARHHGALRHYMETEMAGVAGYADDAWGRGFYVGDAWAAILT